MSGINENKTDSKQEDDDIENKSQTELNSSSNLVQERIIQTKQDSTLSSIEQIIESHSILTIEEFKTVQLSKSPQAGYQESPSQRVLNEEWEEDEEEKYQNLGENRESALIKYLKSKQKKHKNIISHGLQVNQQNQGRRAPSYDNFKLINQ